MTETPDAPPPPAVPSTLEDVQPNVEDVLPTLEDVVPTPDEVSGPLEALLLLADEPRRAGELAAAVGAPEPVVRAALEALVVFYDETGRGFELREVGGGWRYYTRSEHAPLIAASVLEGQQARLSQAALETLAVIAYTQPISRGRVSAVRGVNVDGVIRTLLARGLIEENGHDVDSGAVVFATTSHFLERMGLRSLDDLPALAPHLPEADALEAELNQLATATPAGEHEPRAPLPEDRTDQPLETVPSARTFERDQHDHGEDIT